MVNICTKAESIVHETSHWHISSALVIYFRDDIDQVLESAKHSELHKSTDTKRYDRDDIRLLFWTQ